MADLPQPHATTPVPPEPVTVGARVLDALAALGGLPPDDRALTGLAELVRQGLGAQWVGVAQRTGSTAEHVAVASEGQCTWPSRCAADFAPCRLLDPALGAVILADTRRAATPEAQRMAADGVRGFQGIALPGPDGSVAGYLCAVHAAPCTDDPGARALLAAAASRAALELQRRHDRAALRDQADRLALMQEVSGFSECVWDLEHDHLAITPNWRVRLGHPAEEPDTSNAQRLQLLEPTHLPRLRAFLVDHLKDRATTDAIRFQLRAADGTCRWFELRARVVARNADGRATRMLGILLDVHDAMQAAETQRERAEFLEAAVRGSMDGLWDWDIHTDRAYFSPRFHELLGYADGELPTSFARFVQLAYHPDDAPARTRLLARVLTHDTYLDRDIRMRTRQGQWRWFHSRAYIVRDAHGVARRMVGSASDVTERRQRENELAEARRLLHDAIDHMDAGLLVSDTEDRVVLANRRYAEMYGFRAEQLTPGTPLADLARDLHRRVPAYLAGRDLEAAVRERIAQLHARRGTWELKVGDDWHRISDYPGTDGGTVSLRTDITTLKRTEQALRESEARLRSVVDHTPIGIFLSDLEGRSVFGNARYLRMLQQSASELAADGWQDRVHPDDRARLVDHWFDFVRRGDGEFQHEYRSERDGEFRQFFTRATAIREGARLLGFVGAVEDITARRALEQQQQQSQKMEAIGHLTGGIAHDFNNILASVLGYTRLAQDLNRALSNDALTRYLCAIQEAGELARDLVAKMLAFSRDTPAGEIAPIAPLPVLNDAVRFLQPLIPANVRIHTDFDPLAGGIIVDTVNLYQAMVNLALNARDAIAGHGCISVRLGAPREYRGHCASCRARFEGVFAEITVSDDGCGIPPEHLDRLFEPFFTTKDIGKGSGMGLAVTHGVVHHAGGHLRVRSRPGRGTTVSLLFRAASVVEQAAAPVPTAHTSAGPDRATILVVDDEPMLASFWQELFEGHGYQVQKFTDSLAAQAWASDPASTCDAVLTDQTMPGMTGLELSAALRPLRPSIPIVLCSGYSEHVDPARLAAAGVDRFFTKPVPHDELLRTFESLLSRTVAPG